MISPTALLTALALAEEHGGARAAVRAVGLEANPLEGMEGVRPDLARQLGGLVGADATGEAAALGFLAGRATHRLRTLDVSSFLMDQDLVVRGAEGRSIMRLPWFAADLFVARQVPDITEMPEDVRATTVTNYRAALRGERRTFAFTSYGLRYTVESVPVRGEDGHVRAVLGLARPAAPAADVPLTAREREMLQLAANGLSGPQIAAHLVLSPGTVKTHFQNIYKKWGVSDRAGAVARALRQGLID
ncbi:LuxR C-terminal-related transcriptional regulator [Solirubrobacter phytolaccae]|uniref:LuxR C-terminal-related transcriptional regulator n=1 Tax=Solirubrobacter phytolaccae TaxID=1404360 RepID=A0A9X3N6V4_9ACTN|nr:LuxR C-terminal-related transcriptional regulator [Solirubrobacter phytolaccae]MDA0180571.1 LuxR C-terminal-related transcriptional regulator [Solirubrobacter phytolaccae]